MRERGLRSSPGGALRSSASRRGECGRSSTERLFHAEVDEIQVGAPHRLRFDRAKPMPLEEAARRDAGFREKPGDSLSVCHCLNGCEQRVSDALALVIGVDVEHVDMAIGTEIDEA